MKRKLIITCLAILVNCGQLAFASTAQLFNVRLVVPVLTKGIPGLPLLINTTIPAKTYQFAGIKSITPGYEIQPNRGTLCTMAPNGYCLFSVSDTSAANLIVTVPFFKTINPNSRVKSIPPISILMTLCLNGMGNTYSCENHTVSLNPAG